MAVIREVTEQEAQGTRARILERVRDAYRLKGVDEPYVAARIKSLMKAKKTEVFWNQKAGRPSYTKELPDNPIRLEATKEAAAMLGMYPPKEAPTVELPDISFTLTGVDTGSLRGLDGFARLREHREQIGQGSQEVEVDIGQGWQGGDEQEADRAERPSTPGRDASQVQSEGERGTAPTREVPDP